MSSFVDGFAKGWNATAAGIRLPVIAWLGGAFWVARQPDCGFWDGVIWLWYVGRYIAEHFTVLH